MEVLQIQFTGASGRVVNGQTLTSGMVGAEIAFRFDEAWKGLQKTAVFIGSGVAKDVVAIEDRVVIPWEVLEKPGNLLVGVYGFDNSGKLVLPSDRVSAGPVKPGVSPSGAESPEATPAMWSQILDMVGDLTQLTTQEQHSLVGALNEVEQRRCNADEDVIRHLIEDYLRGYEAGGGKDGVTPEFSIGTVETLAAGAEATASITGTAEKPVLNLGIPQGLPGEAGPQGEQGPQGLPGEGDASADNWEKLNTISVSDDATTSITFTQDSNGNPLSLKKFYLKVTGINGASTYPVLRLNNLRWMEQFGGDAAGSGTNLTMPVLFQILGDGCYCCEWFHPYAQTLRFDGEKTTQGAIQSNIASVTSIYWGWGTGSAITNGAVFELYGVRA